MAGFTKPMAVLVVQVVVRGVLRVQVLVELELRLLFKAITAVAVQIQAERVLRRVAAVARVLLELLDQHLVLVLVEQDYY
jgi:hypothetical protein